MRTHDEKRRELGRALGHMADGIEGVLEQMKPKLARLTTEEGQTSCAECGRKWTDPSERWQSHLTTDDVLAFYSPDCAEREFGEKT